MRYEVHRFKDGSDQVEFWAHASSGEVRDYAKRVVAEGVAEKVEIYDDQSMMVFRWPNPLGRIPEPS